MNIFLCLSTYKYLFIGYINKYIVCGRFCSRTNIILSFLHFLVRYQYQFTATKTWTGNSFSPGFIYRGLHTIECARTLHVEVRRAIMPHYLETTTDLSSSSHPTSTANDIKFMVNSNIYSTLLIFDRKSIFVG